MITLKDARRGTELLVLQATPDDAHGALCVAARQARRHAALGTWVLLSSLGRHYLYVGRRHFVACVGCGRWMVPAHRQDSCSPCRRDSASRRRRGAVPLRAPRRKRPAAPDMELRLPRGAASRNAALRTSAA